MNSTKENCSSWTLVTKRSTKKVVQSTNINRKMNIDVKKKPPISKATQPSLIKKEITIEPDLMGFVVGRKGDNLERLKVIYGVKFILPPRGGSLFTIEGPSEKMVSAAMKDIEERLSYKTRFFVEKDYISMVIGRAGEIVQALEQTLDVKIKILLDGEVVITGIRCEEAKKAIEENLLVKTSFFIEKDYYRLLIDNDGEKIQALEDTLNIRIVISIEDGQVEVIGVRCEEAKEAIEENLSRVTNFFIEKDYRFLVIGQEGKTICALKKAHNVNIHINEEGKVLIMGKQSEAAKKAIESLIKKFKTDYPYEEKFSVPAHLLGLVFGKDGRNRNRIQSNYGVHVLFSSSESVYDDVPQLIIVRGPEAGNVSAAKQDILENLGTTLDLDVSFVGRIIGHGGETVRRIAKEYDVFIHFGQKKQDGNGRQKVYIDGEKSRSKAAKDDIISVITGRKNG